MASPKVFQPVTDAWVDVIGAASGVAGVSWQNIGPGMIGIAFTTAAPAGGATDAVHVLGPQDAFYDKNGSAHAWVKRMGKGAAHISATAD